MVVDDNIVVSTLPKIYYICIHVSLILIMFGSSYPFISTSLESLCPVMVGAGYPPSDGGEVVLVAGPWLGVSEDGLLQPLRARVQQPVGTAVGHQRPPHQHRPRRPHQARGGQRPGSGHGDSSPQQTAH